MDYIDISMDLNERTVVWKDDAAPKLIPICRTPAAPCNFTWLDFSAHAGTHIDAPYYLFSSSWTADQIPLERLIGRCQVLDLTAIEGTIGPEHLEAAGIRERKLLLKTKNSLDYSQRYNPLHADMSPAAARYLVDRGVETLGFDYQSFERDGAVELHRIFLEKRVTLIDNLVLRDAPPGIYRLVCLPIKVTGIDAAPSRAILLPEAA